MKQSDIDALKRDFDYNVEKADQEGAFWTRLFAMSVNVFIREFMGRRHFDRAVFMAMAVLMPIIMFISNGVINAATRGQHGDFPIILFVFLWFCFAIYRKFETRKLINIEGVKLHGKYRGTPFPFWQKIPFLAPHMWEAVAVGLVGFLISFYPYTNLDLFLYGAAIGKILFETIDRTARKEAEQDEQDARLETNHMFFHSEDESENVQEYEGRNKPEVSTNATANLDPLGGRSKAEHLLQRSKNDFNLDGAEFDINKHKSAKDDD